MERGGVTRSSSPDAMVAGDVAMLEPEVTPVLKALRANGLNVVAIHHHMTDVKQKSTVALCLPRAPHLRRFSSQAAPGKNLGIRRNES